MGKMFVGSGSLQFIVVQCITSFSYLVILDSYAQTAYLSAHTIWLQFVTSLYNLHAIPILLAKTYHI